jgi:hypothetical protein
MKKLFLGLLLLFLPFVAGNVAECAISQGNTTEITSTSDTSVNFFQGSHNNNVSDGNVVIVIAAYDTMSLATSATYDGNSMTLIDSEQTRSYKVSMFRIIAGSSGSNTVRVNYSASTEQKRYAIGVITLNGVDQDTPVGQTGTDDSLSSDNLNVALTSLTANSWLVDAVSIDSSFATATATGGAAPTVSAKSTWGWAIGSRKEAISAGSNSMGYTISNGAGQGMVAAEFLEGEFAGADNALDFGANF